VEDRVGFAEGGTIGGPQPLRNEDFPPAPSRLRVREAHPPISGERGAYFKPFLGDEWDGSNSGNTFLAGISPGPAFTLIPVPSPGEGEGN
jgi:hypothetical protein